MLDPLRPLAGNSVAVVGFGPTRDRAPWGDAEGWPELWTLNRLPLQPDAGRWTRHFDAHPLEWSERHFTPELWSQYAEWLGRDHGDKLIYLSRQTDAVPNSAALPIEELVRFVGRPYFTSGIAYMLGLALMLGAKRIGLWGIDFRHDTEFAFERPNAEWLLGLAQGRGVKIVLPPDASILNEDGHAPLYGLADESNPLADVEHMLNNRLSEINQLMPKLQEKNDALLREMYLGEGAREQTRIFLDAIRLARRGGRLLGSERK